MVIIAKLNTPRKDAIGMLIIGQQVEGKKKVLINEVATQQITKGMEPNPINKRIGTKVRKVVQPLIIVSFVDLWTTKSMNNKIYDCPHR